MSRTLKPVYYSSKAIDKTCRDKTCPTCRRMHEYKTLKVEMDSKEQIKELK